MMKNDELELENTVKKYYLNAAIEALDNNGRYWNSKIPKMEARKLYQILEECYGYQDLMHASLKPRYEHVFYFNSEHQRVNSIALERDRLQNLNPNIQEHELPI